MLPLLLHHLPPHAGRVRGLEVVWVALHGRKGGYLRGFLPPQLPRLFQNLVLGRLHQLPRHDEVIAERAELPHLLRLQLEVAGSNGHLRALHQAPRPEVLRILRVCDFGGGLLVLQELGQRNAALHLLLQARVDLTNGVSRALASLSHDLCVQFCFGRSCSARGGG